MGRLLELFSKASPHSALWPGFGEFALPDLTLPDLTPGGAEAEPLDAEILKVLLVVAHPDDESECAGTLYRITHELKGVVDQVIVTTGEGGQHFTSPALDYYGLPRESGIAKELPKLRRKEAIRAGAIIGVRRHYFLGQKDPGFTLDAGEGLRVWDPEYVRRELRHLVRREHYDLVLTLLPTTDTHGHHKTVAVLVLEAIQTLPRNEQPSVIGVRTGALSAASPEFTELPDFPVTRTTTAAPFWSFDRRTPLGRQPALDHSIIVHWVIAEHKSQGLFQMEYGRHTHEHFWLFANVGQGSRRLASLFRKLDAPTPRFETAAAA